jgi:uncharacterized membrane protein
MSAKEPGAVYKIVAFTFAGRKKALAISDDLKATGKYAAHKVVASTTVEIDEKGKTHLHEAGHVGLGTGIGFVAGGLLGLLGGAEGLLVWAVLGAVIGRQVGKSRDRPIPIEDLERLAAQMQPDTSAILALVADKEAEALIRAMAGYEAQVVTMTLSDAVSGEVGQMPAARARPAGDALTSAGAGPTAEAPDQG